MTNAHDVVEIPLHPRAEELARTHINEFATALLFQAKLLAYQQKAEVVLTSYIDQARESILSSHKLSRARELELAIGGAIFGAFVQGFIGELSAETLRPLWIAVYTAAGFIGILLIFWGLRR